jgi:hypothetical protein
LSQSSVNSSVSMISWDNWIICAISCHEHNDLIWSTNVCFTYGSSSAPFFFCVFRMSAESQISTWRIIFRMRDFDKGLIWGQFICIYLQFTMVDFVLSSFICYCSDCETKLDIGPKKLNRPRHSSGG